MQLRIDDLHRYETEMLADIMRISEENELPVFAAYGTVLGAVRHEGPIPWDSDADTVVLLSQFERTCKTLAAELPDKYSVRSYCTNGDRKILYAKIGLRGYSDEKLHVDLFPLIPMPNGSVRRYIYHFLTVTLKWIHFNKMHRLHRQNLLGMLLCKLVPLSADMVRDVYMDWIKRYDEKKAEFYFVSHGTYSNTRVFFNREFFLKGEMVEYDGIRLRIPDNSDAYLRLQYGDYMQYPPEEERKKVMERVFTIPEKV